MNNLLVENTPRSGDRRERQNNRQTLGQATRASRMQEKLCGRSVDTLPLYSQNIDIVINSTNSDAALEPVTSNLPSILEVDKSADTPPDYGQVNGRV